MSKTETAAVETTDTVEKTADQIRAEKIAATKAAKKAELENETKAGAFIRLGKVRTVNVLESLRMLQSLATANYEYTPDQWGKIFGAIDKKLEEVKKQALDGVAPAVSGFEL